MAPLHPKYVPVDTEPQSAHHSSFTVLRVTDQQHFLATLIPTTLTIDPAKHFRKSGQDAGKLSSKSRLSSCIIPTAQISLSRLLNHPNIVSLVDIVQGSEVAGQHVPSGAAKDGEVEGPTDFTIWEDMNAGCLAYLLPSAEGLPGFEDRQAWHALSFRNYQRPSLPEGLCWHVLLSITKSLLWLHYGIKETAGVKGEYLKHDDDWQPILIRDVSPGQIWFKHPVKAEDYGECKLGGFAWAKVTGAPGAELAIEQPFDKASVEKQFYWAPEIWKNSHSWNRKTEIWALGAVVYTMMTGIPPPRLYDYDWQISRMNDKGYSQMIRDTVAEMLKPDSLDRPDALRLLDKAQEAYRAWRTGTVDGNLYVDIDDEYVKKQWEAGQTQRLLHGLV
ncbi:kinase-like domain-containing protein [Bisporella sp. PMI_857]|nr:kinase-like domain-containing protein [Bisporella sp. PMI_857]